MLQIFLTLLSKLHFRMLIMSNSVAVLVTFWLVTFVTLFLRFPHEIASKGSPETSAATLPSIAYQKMIFSTCWHKHRSLVSDALKIFRAFLSLRSSAYPGIFVSHHPTITSILNWRRVKSSKGRTGALILKDAHQLWSLYQRPNFSSMYYTYCD